MRRLVAIPAGLLAVASTAVWPTGPARADAPLAATAPALDVGSEDARPSLCAEPGKTLDRANALLQAMRASADLVRRTYDDARVDKDIVKLNFLTEKQAVTLRLLGVAEQSVADLERVLGHHDEAAARHEMSKLEIISSKLQQIAAVSVAAVGGAALYVGDTAVEVVVDSARARTSDTRPVEAYLQAPGRPVVFMRPAAASPYQ